MTAKKADWKQERKDLVEHLQRLQAEFENYKKRTEKEQVLAKEQANAVFIAEILPIIDNLELALANNTEKNNFTKGIELIYAQLLEQLEAKGLAVVYAEGAFDPHRHEAMLTEIRKDVEADTIIETLQKGYTLNERIIRTAKVKVSKGA